MSGRDEKEMPSAGSPDATVDASKDACFARVAALGNEMIRLHGKDFAMGTLVLAARFIAEDKPLDGGPKS